jgi:hypothetical protein
MAERRRPTANVPSVFEPGDLVEALHSEDVWLSAVYVGPDQGDADTEGQAAARHLIRWIYSGATEAVEEPRIRRPLGTPGRTG